MGIHVIGGGWVTASGYGRIGDGTRPVLTAGVPAVPPPGEIFVEPPLRFRRFDSYCRIGCAAIALALRDAGMDRAEGARPVGIVAATRYGSFETDLAFQESAAVSDGLYASPGLFSYTLPGIALSEAAIHFRLTGPTFTVGDPAGRRGLSAVEIAIDLLAAGVCPAVLAGWIEAESRLLKHRAADDDGLRGAVFLVLAERGAPGERRGISRQAGGIYALHGRKIASILELAS
jgi:3-oxoacyl-[acyl-carrier-protein] synthase II